MILDKKKGIKVIANAIMTKFYITIYSATFIIFLWVLKHFNDAGYTKYITKTFVDQLEYTKSIAQNCIPRITNINSFIYCVKNPPRYEGGKEKEIFKQEIMKLMDSSGESQEVIKKQIEQMQPSQKKKDKNPYKLEKEIK